MQPARTQILVVDDEAGIRELFRAVLEEDGYICQTASSGNGALEVLSAGNIALALVDVNMPRMTGLSLFRHIADLHPDVGVMFVTAVDDVELVSEHLNRGAYDYLVKPVSQSRLLQAVKTALERRAAIAEGHRQREHLEELVIHQSAALRNRDQEVRALNQLIQGSLATAVDRIERNKSKR